jgi:hypothetical protein
MGGGLGNTKDYVTMVYTLEVELTILSVRSRTIKYDNLVFG